MLRKDIIVDDVKMARVRIDGDINYTPLLAAPELADINSKRSCTSVSLKCENFQRTKSFKVRGAFSALRGMEPEDLSRGVVTRSSGNFAQALSLAASELGVSATIVMPENAPQVKLEGTERYGASIVQHGISTQEGMAKVFEIAEQEKRTILSPFDHPKVIAGQGTAALEILEQMPDIANFFCPVGGGGLLAGCALVLKSLKPSIRIFAVEPDGADDYFMSHQSGIRVTLEKTQTIADGLRTTAVGELTWPLLQQYVDDVLVVSDEKIKESMCILRDEMGLVVEPSGAVAYAGWRKCDLPMADGPSVCLLSGANVDREIYRSLTE